MDLFVDLTLGILKLFEPDTKLLLHFFAPILGVADLRFSSGYQIRQSGQWAIFLGLLSFLLTISLLLRLLLLWRDNRLLSLLIYCHGLFDQSIFLNNRHGDCLRCPQRLCLRERFR